MLTLPPPRAMFVTATLKLGKRSFPYVVSVKDDELQASIRDFTFCSVVACGRGVLVDVNVRVNCTGDLSLRSSAHQVQHASNMFCPYGQQH